MLDPWEVLKTASTLLKPSGSIYASIPNVGHITIMEQLLSGTWTYTESGLLDKTHFGFFTKAEIYALFDSQGFDIIAINQLMNTGERETRLLERTTAFQYIVHARKRE